MTPHINWRLDSFSLSADIDEKGALSTRLHIEVENEGAVPFTVTGLSLDIPGLRLLPPDKAEGESAAVTAAGGHRVVMERRLAITDCAAVPHEPQPVRFTYETYLASRTVEVIWSSWRLTAPHGETVEVAWQRALSDDVCSEAVSGEWF